MSFVTEVAALTVWFWCGLCALQELDHNLFVGNGERTKSFLSSRSSLSSAIARASRNGPRYAKVITLLLSHVPVTLAIGE